MRRGVGWHHDDGRRAEEASRPGDALGVVARRVGDDAPGEVRGRSEAIVAYAPRSLNAPMGCSDSALRNARPSGGPKRDERRVKRDARANARRRPRWRRGRRAAAPRSDRPLKGCHRCSRSARRWHSMQCAAHGSASSRPRRDRPAAPDARAVRPRVERVRGPHRQAASWWSARSRRARSRCCAKTWLAAAACEP